MTIKELADDLGVSKEKIKYLYRQLPEYMYVMVENRVILSDAAIDAIKNRLNGGELTSEIPVPPYNAINPVGWGITENAGNTGKNSDNFGDSSENSGDVSGLSGETRLKSGDGENSESSESNKDHALTIFDYFKSTIDSQTIQLEAKDEQIRALTAQLDKLTTVISERNTATSEQLIAKDAQLSRMQGTVDALTKQLADAAERERQLQATIEQSREVPRRWWQWWKR